MDIITFLESFPDEALTVFESGMVLAFVGLFVFGLLDDIIRGFDNILSRRFRSAWCMGIHSGNISSVCLYHACPYSMQCAYHAPRRSFKVWLSDGIQKLKRHS